MSINLELVFNDLLAYFGEIELIKEIKSGKEASVFLINADSNLYALKVYKENSHYSSKNEYMMMDEIQDSRTKRAVKKKSNKGLQMLENIWVEREFTIMKTLHNLGANIPQVYYRTQNAIVMEYLGEIKSPAPRLSDITLSSEDAEVCFETIIKTYKLFIDVGIVHGDFSEYNILWHKQTPYIIDFPQILYIENNRNAHEKFMKDLKNVRRYFGRYKLTNLDRELWGLERYY